MSQPIRGKFEVTSFTEGYLVAIQLIEAGAVVDPQTGEQIPTNVVYARPTMTEVKDDLSHFLAKVSPLAVSKGEPTSEGTGLIVE